MSRKATTKSCGRTLKVTRGSDNSWTAARGPVFGLRNDQIVQVAACVTAKARGGREGSVEIDGTRYPCDVIGGKLIARLEAPLEPGSPGQEIPQYLKIMGK